VQNRCASCIDSCVLCSLLIRRISDFAKKLTASQSRNASYHLEVHYRVHNSTSHVSILKCTLVQAPRPCAGRADHRGSRGIALLFLHHGTRRGWGVNVTPRPLFTPGKDPVPFVQKAGWAPGPVWTGAEHHASTGIRFPDHPARSQFYTDWATRPTHVSILSHINPLKALLSTLLPSIPLSSKLSFSLRFTHYSPVGTSSPPHTSLTPRLSNSQYIFSL
jgi:hypothetical protein